MTSPIRTTDPSALLLRVEEAAARLGIARTSMFHLLATRQVESVLVGRSRRIPVACLHEYVDRLRRQNVDAEVAPTEHGVAAGRRG